MAKHWLPAARDYASRGIRARRGPVTL